MLRHESQSSAYMYMRYALSHHFALDTVRRVMSGKEGGRGPTNAPVLPGGPDHCC